MVRRRVPMLLLACLAACRDDVETGRLCLSQGDWKRACRHFEAAVDRDPADLEARTGLGKALLQKSQALEGDGKDRAADWDAAVLELGIAAQSRPDTVVREALYRARLQAARCLAREGDTLAALRRLERLREAAPRRVAARNLEAVLRYRKGEFERARTLFLENAALDSNDASVRFNLGLLCWHTGRTAEAVDHLVKAARLSPKDPEILYWLGKVAGGAP